MKSTHRARKHWLDRALEEGSLINDPQKDLPEDKEINEALANLNLKSGTEPTKERKTDDDSRTTS